MLGESAHRARGSRVPLSLVLVVLLMLLAVSGRAEAQSSSGSAQLGNSLQYGTTSYTVHYSYPSTADVGTNLTISVSVHVNAFSGLVEYIANYALDVDLFVNGQVLQESVFSGSNATFLYPGSTWGPTNVVFPLNATATGLAGGQSTNATVSVILRDGIYYGAPYNVFTTEPPMQGGAGSLTIQNAATTSTTTTTAQGGAYLPYALLVAVGVVLILGAAFWPGGRSSVAQK